MLTKTALDHQAGLKRRPVFVRAAWIILCSLCLAALLVGPHPVSAADGITPCTAEPTNMNIGYGSLVSCEIGTAGDTDSFQFSGTSGEQIIVEVAFISGSLRPCVELIAPNGATAATYCENSFNAEIDTTLTQTGSYRILVYALMSSLTGSYGLSLERLIAPSSNATPVQYGNTYQSTLDLASDLDLYTFAGEANTTVRAEMTFISGPMRPCIQLIAPDNTRLVNCDNAFDNWIDTKLTQSGTYAILLSDIFWMSTGSYTLAIERLMPPSSNAGQLSYGIVQPDALNPGGDLDLFQFKGKSGGRIRLQVTHINGSMRPCIELIAPDHSRQAACANAFSNMVDTTLTQTGTYAVLITDLSASGTGNYNLELQCIAGICEDRYPMYLPDIRRY